MPRGRGRVQQRRPQVEIADREGSPNSSSSDLIPETQDLQDTQTHPSSEEEGVKKKKRIRASKKDIPDYHWKEDNELVLVDLVKDHPQLYGKKHRDHLNTGAKNIIWERVGEQLNPPATGAQYKKKKKKKIMKICVPGWARSCGKRRRVGQVGPKGVTVTVTS